MINKHDGYRFIPCLFMAHLCGPAVCCKLDVMIWR